MQACTGWEILTEIMGHLRIKEEASRILEISTCIPCMMPFITKSVSVPGQRRSASGRTCGVD
jgi:myosin-crossreactive antigen